MKNWAIVSVVRAKDAATAAANIKNSDIVSVKKVNLVKTNQGEQYADCIGFSSAVEEEDFEDAGETEETEQTWGFNENK